MQLVFPVKIKLRSRDQHLCLRIAEDRLSRGLVAFMSVKETEHHSTRKFKNLRNLFSDGRKKSFFKATQY